MYEDAVELQLFFIKKRDEVCKNGEILVTPALSYLENHLHRAVEVERRDKMAKEHAEEEKKRLQDTNDNDPTNMASKVRPPYIYLA